jgi:hypothetical protein
MSYDSEWDEVPEPPRALERVRSASADMRFLLSMHNAVEGLKIVLGPNNYERALDYLDCIDTNSQKLKEALEAVPTNVHAHDCGMEVGDDITACTCHCAKVRSVLEESR